MPEVQTQLPANAFLRDILVYDVDSENRLSSTDDTSLDQLATTALTSGLPEIAEISGESSTPGRMGIAIPVYQAGVIVSVVVLAKTIDEDAAGVFEVWSPIGPYEELGLTSGYFGKLSRFENVSSFVRFEKGSGLPGQVWNGFRSVIHENLPEHPGFLRAAGASAGSLDTAIGIPVAGADFLASVVLISGKTNPIANGFEVWRAEENGFTLESSTYGLASFAIEPGTQIPTEAGIPGLVHRSGAAVVCSDKSLLAFGRNGLADPDRVSCGVAIPFYESDVLTSVTVLLL